MKSFQVGRQSVLRIRTMAVAICVSVFLATPGSASAGKLRDAAKSTSSAARSVASSVKAKTSSTVTGGIGSGGDISAIVDSVRPLVELVRERQQEYQAFDAEAFRYEFAAAIDNIAYLQSSLFGHVGPGIARLQDKIRTAHPMLLFALSESPLAMLLEKTQGMDDELLTIVRLTISAEDFVMERFSRDQVRRIGGLGLSIAAPDFVSCSFVLGNVDGDDITNLKLSRLRAKQISGIAGLALKVLPKSQTIGVNVVGGATVSIPNPVTPLAATLQKVADRYYEMTKKWTKKYDKCKQMRLNQRLAEFLEDQGYPLVEHGSFAETVQHATFFD